MNLSYFGGLEGEEEALELVASPQVQPSSAGSQAPEPLSADLH